MSFQSDTYLSVLGDLWLSKNIGDVGKRDPISDIIEATDLPLGGRILEVGCSNGWRLKRLRDKHGCEVHGIDPSHNAVVLSNDPAVKIGLSTKLPYPDKHFDTVIMGFCLYAICPEDWFMTVAESDRVLKDGGHIIIWDFTTTRDYKRRMVAEDVPLYMYHTDWPKLWTVNPIYAVRFEQHHIKKLEMVSVIHKSLSRGFPLVEEEI